MKVDHGRLAQIRAWDGGDGEIADQIAVEEAIALLTRARVLKGGMPRPSGEGTIPLHQRSTGRLHLYAQV